MERIGRLNSGCIMASLMLLINSPFLCLELCPRTHSHGPPEGITTNLEVLPAGSRTVA
jgi:hypothetical protein